MKTRRTLKFILAGFIIVFFIGLIGFTFIAINNNKKKDINKKYIPEFAFQKIDGSLYTNDSIPKNKPIIILFIDPDCHFCTDEIQELIHEKSYFKLFTILMVTNAENNRIKELDDLFSISVESNFILLQDAKFVFWEHFSPKSIPYSLFYNSDHEYIKDHVGKFEIEFIKKIYQ